MPTLVLLRHGESEWNAEDRFTGWVDVDLTAEGRDQAAHSGALLRQAGLHAGAMHTSVLRRAEVTGALALQAAGQADVPTSRSWRLNERCYGVLQGQPRSVVRARFGPRQFDLWRRSYDVAPPPLEPGSRWDVSADPAYAGLDVPRTESLSAVAARLLPYWCDFIVPDLQAGRTVLVVAHGNSLRALIAHLDALSPEEVMGLNVPTGMPLRYDLRPDLSPAVRGGAYLDPERARRAASEVAEQGRSLPLGPGAPGHDDDKWSVGLTKAGTET